MRLHVPAAACLLSAALFALPTTSHAITFGKKDGVKVVNGAPFKDSSSFALGAFRVTFITDDEVASLAKGSWVTGGSSSSASMNASLEGLDHATMQRLADGIYEDFLKQASAKGIKIMDSAKLAQTSPAYKALASTPNFEEGRLGTIVVPTGQQSVILAQDGSAKANKGSKGLMAQWKQMGANDFASAEINKAGPGIAKEAGMPVIGVTVVVNFADFKGGEGSFGHSSVGIKPGATIEGQANGELLRQTSMVGWNSKSANCAQCLGVAALQGTMHSDAPIGSTETSKAKKSVLGNVLTGPTESSTRKGMVLTVDLPAYQAEVMKVATEANGLLVAELNK